MQNSARHLVAQFVTVGFHFGAFVQHFAGHAKHLLHDRCGAFFLGQVQTGFPTFDGQLFGHLFGKGQ